MLWLENKIVFEIILMAKSTWTVNTISSFTSAFYHFIYQEIEIEIKIKLNCNPASLKGYRSGGHCIIQSTYSRGATK